MRDSCLNLLLMACLVTSGAVGRAANSEAAEPSTGTAWSESLNGLRGRLVVALEELQPGLRYAVTIELENTSTHPISITNQPPVSARLLNAGGAEVTEVGFPMSGPVPFAQTAVIPRDAYLGFRIDMQTVGVPVDGTALLAVGGRTWALQPNQRYVLQATVLVEKTDGVVQEAWTGRLDLPSVDIQLVGGGISH